jgi:peptidoglycan/LPS O-acetylase OafA/YrhL
MDALALGGLGALALRTPEVYAWLAPRLGKATWALGAALAVVVVAARGFPRQNPISQTVGYSVLALFFLALLLLAVVGGRAGSPLAAWLDSKALRALGQYSYGLYVLHVPIADALHAHVDLASGSAAHRIGLRLGFTVVVVGLSFAGALASYHLLEKRLLDLKRFFAPGAPMNASNRAPEPAS